MVSFFSGSEILLPMLDELKMCWLRYGIDLKFESIFSAEIDDWKRERIIRLHGPKHAYEDVVEVSKAKWTGHDYIVGGDTEVERPDILWVGFECDSVSGLNMQKTQREADACVGLNTLRTGTTANATLLFICEKRPTISILENVKTIGRQNIQAITKILNRHGFVMHPIYLEAFSTYLCYPCCRE